MLLAPREPYRGRLHVCRAYSFGEERECSAVHLADLDDRDRPTYRPTWNGMNSACNNRTPFILSSHRHGTLGLGGGTPSDRSRTCKVTPNLDGMNSSFDYCENVVDDDRNTFSVHQHTGRTTFPDAVKAIDIS